MASISRVSASALSVHNEVQASLASVNFDFSLLKFEAPAEYAPVGGSLTKLRKQNAEDGSTHIIARKLAALFGSVLPPTPKLFRAYGLRASEITNSPTNNPKGTSEHGPFAAHIGADATSIWAAATSGKGALALHLLACLLARIWPANEAVSIWMELVKQQRIQLEEQMGSGAIFHEGSFYASRTEITRHQLTQWDASARAWLSIADRAKEKQQIQLRLIIDNLSIPVKSANNTFESVIETWTGSMKLLEEVISGKPIRVQTGAALLGLSAWHIYPDLCVTTTETMHIAQCDNLVPSTALVTIGLSPRPELSNAGIYWSLPLAHLRHYGKPQIRTRSSGLSDSRVSFDFLLYVALGSTFRTWQIPDSNIKRAMSLLRVLWKNFRPVFSWLGPLDQACANYERLDDEDKMCADRLMTLGFRHSNEFMGKPPDCPAPAFGLTDISLLLRICLDPYSRIKLLRYWALRYSTPPKDCIIRYFVPNSEVERFTTVEHPQSKKRKRRAQDEFEFLQPRYWVHENQKHKFTGHKNLQSELNQQNDTSAIEEMLYARDDDPGMIQEDEHSTFYFPYNLHIRPYRFVAGDLRLAAIFCPSTGQKETKRAAGKDLLSCTQLETFLVWLCSKVEIKALHILAKTFCLAPLLKVHSRYVASFQALRWAHELYRHFPEAHVDLRVRTRPLDEAFFFQTEPNQHGETRSDGFGPLNTPELWRLFSCLAYFETGFVNIKPIDMINVMAISYQESIYVSEGLLQDPATKTNSCPIRRFIGNFGKPGLSILHPPLAPEIKKLNPDISWRVVGHHDFSGKYEDNFATTSLHLSFTGSEVPYGKLRTGEIHQDVYFIEALIQAYDRGQWIADLDVLSGLNQAKLGWPSELVNYDENVIKQRFSTVCSWDELLDDSPGYSIFLGHQNWMARLAAVTILAQQGRKFRLIPCDEPKPAYNPDPILEAQHPDRSWEHAFNRDATPCNDAFEVADDELEAADVALHGVDGIGASLTEWYDGDSGEETDDVESLLSFTSSQKFERETEPPSRDWESAREIRRPAEDAEIQEAVIFIC